MKRTGSAMESASVADFLVKFPGPIVLCPSRKLLADAYLWLAGSVFCLSRALATVWVLLFACVMGLGAFLSTAPFLFPQLAAVTLNRQGFYIRRVFCTQMYHWGEVTPFEVNRFTVWRFQTRRRVDRSIGFKTNRVHVGILDVVCSGPPAREGYIPNRYGLAAEDLAQLMNERRELAIS
jgi:hypothetical protein